VIVTDFDVIRIAVNKAKADAPLIIDGDSVLALAITLERVQSIAGRDLKVVERRSEVNILELAHGTRLNVAWEPLRRPGGKEILSPAIGERFDHA
jgi:hypothetical protein